MFTSASCNKRYLYCNAVKCLTYEIVGRGVCEKQVLNFFYGKLYEYLILIQNKAKFISINSSETPVLYSYLRSIPPISVFLVKVLGFNSF